MHELESTEDVEVFQKQIDLLKRRLYEQPQFFHQVFITEGTNAIAWEFQQPELGRDFILSFWKLLTREDAMSTMLMRFIWNVPLGYKRKFIRALDTHLSDRYPMFDGLSQGWPAENGISPYIRPPAERSRDFDLVSQGYLGYMGLGYSAREVELLVWLEVLRDKQCEDGPCQMGELIPGQEEPKGGCPVRIHIPEVLRLMGEGKFRCHGADYRGQSPAQCHRPRLPTGAPVPGGLQAEQASDRDRPAGVVPAPEHETVPRSRRQHRRGRQSLGQG